MRGCQEGTDGLGASAQWQSSIVVGNRVVTPSSGGSVIAVDLGGGEMFSAINRDGDMFLSVARLLDDISSA